MDSHLTSQSSTIFRSVHSLIYIFDAESPELSTSDTTYFLKCLNALRDQNHPDDPSVPPPTVFVLLHKMDLVPEGMQGTKLAEFQEDVEKRAKEGGWRGDLQFYGTSIWNETLYKVPSLSSSSCPRPARARANKRNATIQQAWSIVVAHLMPSLSSLRAHLSHFLTLTSASEVVLFERTTFLVISSVTAPKKQVGEGEEGEGEEEEQEWDERRFERISTMVKAFKLACT